MWLKLVSVIVILLILYGLAMIKLYRMAPKGYKPKEIADSRTLELPGGSIRYQDSGEGTEAIILLHGFNANFNQFSQVWENLQNQGRVVRLDIPGYGESDWQTHNYSLDKQAQRIVLMMDKLGIEKAVFSGVSMGASLSAWLASQYPERVIGVVLGAPSGYSGSLNYSGHFGYFLKPGVANKLAIWVANSSPYKWWFPDSKALQALSVTASYGPPWDQAIQGITHPVILLWSKGDRATLYQYAKVINEKIPDSVLISLPEAVGHDVEQCTQLITTASRLLFEQKKPLDLKEIKTELKSQAGCL